MLKIKLLSIFLMLSAGLRGQDTATIYYDSSWDICESENAIYYRKALLNKDSLWKVNDFFITGELQMTGTFKDKLYKRKTGEFIYYNKDGSIRTKTTYGSKTRALRGPFARAQFPGGKQGIIK